MITATSTITSAATRNPNGPFNILIFPHDPEFHGILGKTPHNFYVLRHPTLDWNYSKGNPPTNHMLLPIDNEIKKMPTICDADFIISQSRNTDEFGICYGISQFYHLPIIAIESENKKDTIMPQEIIRGHLNIFNTEIIRSSWLIFDERNSILLMPEDNTPQEWQRIFIRATKIIFKGNNKL